MTTRTPSPGQLEQSFARASKLQAELGRKVRAIGRKVQVLALGLAGLMEPGAHLHRTGVGLHALRTVLEHRFGAVLLGHLLTGDPVPSLGDDATPVCVRFQASAFSPVDDLLVSGRIHGGEQRWISIGVRGTPALVASDEASGDPAGPVTAKPRRRPRRPGAGCNTVACAGDRPGSARMSGVMCHQASAMGGLTIRTPTRPNPGAAARTVSGVGGQIVVPLRTPHGPVVAALREGMDSG